MIRSRLTPSGTDGGRKQPTRTPSVRHAIETGNPAARLETILAVLTALDLEFRIVPRSKGTAAELEDIF